MPKIPSINESVRIQQGTPVGAIPVEEAAARGRAYAGLGQDIQQFAMQFDVYRRVKEQDSKVQFALEWKNRSTLMGQEAERFVKTNPNAAPDGSSVQNDFDSSYGRIYADIDSLEDPEQKRMAKNIADQVAAKYKRGLLTYEIGKYNQFSEESIQKASDDMTLIISNDPTKFAEALADFENAVNSQVNLSADMKAKLIPAARKQAGTAYLNSLMSNKQYAAAREALKTKEIGGLFDETARQKFREEIDRREFTDAKRIFDKEELNIKRRKQQREEQREAVLTNLYGAMFDAQTPDSRELVLEQAEDLVRKGILKKSDYDALEKMEDEALTEVDQETEFKYVDRMHRGDLKGMHDAILKDVASDNLKPSTAGRLLKQLEQRKKGLGSSSKEFAARLKNGQAFLRSAFEGSSRDIFGRPIVDKDKQFDLFAAQREFNDMVYNKGIDPEEAATRIVGARDPRRLQGTVPGVPLEFQKSPEAIHKYIEQRKKNPPKNKKEMEEYLETLKQLKKRMDVLSQEQMKKTMGKDKKDE